MKQFFKSVGFAVEGIFFFFRNEINGRCQLIISLLVIIAGFFFKISATEWLAILGCIVLVISLEMMNSAIEHLCNVITREHNLSIKIIKDVSAAAVLFASVIAAIIGVIVFTPYCLKFISGV